MARSRAVRRDDGKEYASITDACRDLINEGYRGNPYRMHPNILAVIQGRGRTAYGHQWEEIDGRSKGEVARELEEVTARLAAANTILRENGLEEQ